MSTPDTDPDAVPLGEVLRRMEREAGSLARMGEEMQDALSKTLGATALTSHDLVAFQALDALSQRVAGLAMFLGRLAEQVPEGWAVRPALAAETLTLSCLAHRLSTNGAEHPSAPSGEAHLF